MNIPNQEKYHELAQILLGRLERISADSPWAHQASGIRAAIARMLSRGEDPLNLSDNEYLKVLINQGFVILENAAGDIPEE